MPNRKQILPMKINTSAHIPWFPFYHLYYHHPSSGLDIRPLQLSPDCLLHASNLFHSIHFSLPPDWLLFLKYTPNHGTLLIYKNKNKKCLLIAYGIKSKLLGLAFQAFHWLAPNCFSKHPLLTFFHPLSMVTTLTPTVHIPPPHMQCSFTMFQLPWNVILRTQWTFVPLNICMYFSLFNALWPTNFLPILRPSLNVFTYG